MENRQGLLVDISVMPADGFAERDAAVMMLEALKSRNERATVGAEKGYGTATFIPDCRHLGVTPHVAQTTNSRCWSAIDQRTTRAEGYNVRRVRKRMEAV